jgi:hypothetical protein
MEDLYVENFFHRQTASLTDAGRQDAPVEVISEEASSQIHFHLRVLKEEISKQLKETPPFPLMLEKLEKAIFSQNVDEALIVLEDLEEFLDLQYLPKV